MDESPPPTGSARRAPQRSRPQGIRALLGSAGPALVLFPLLSMAVGPSGSALKGAVRHRGVCFAHAGGLGRERGYGSAPSAESLRQLKELGVDWISITPFGFQRATGDETFLWGVGDETDDSLRRVTDQAHALGIRVMLKPHLWLRPPHWPGDVDPGSEPRWKAWFACYRAFILHYAALSASARMDALCIGNELEKSTAHEREWRDIIGAIRGSYRGPLTYGAGMEEVFHVPFWDALDFIGVSAYYPLVEARDPGRAALAAAWAPVTSRLSALASSTGRQILFTEIGYRSADFGGWKHWETKDAPVNLGLQARAYEAFFEAVWPQSWFAGAYFWKWFSYPNHSGPWSNDWEPQGKPAEAVLRRFYSRPP